MTREEIMQLNTDYLNGCESEHKMNELFSYALEQQPSDTVSRDDFEPITSEEMQKCKDIVKKYTPKQEPCEDAISRQRVLDLINADWKYENLEQPVSNLPSVTPQQKYGKWILADEQDKEDVENDNYRFICSECQCSDIHAKGAIVPYCWKCGAIMDEPQESEEV